MISLYRIYKTTGCEYEDGSDTRKTETSLVLVRDNEQDEFEEYCIGEFESQDYSYQFERTKIATFYEGEIEDLKKAINTFETEHVEKKLDINLLGKVITDMVKTFDDEIFAKTQEQLEECWHFDFSKATNTAQSYYEFTKALELYKDICRRWEEHHNGITCVVERVRDQYIMPKIEIFRKKVTQ